jgi:hypothetical protein
MSLEAAFAYAERLGWALLPMRGKHFYTRDGVRIATRDVSRIARWSWAESIGMACGAPSGSDVLDVDDPSGVPFDLAALLTSNARGRLSSIFQARRRTKSSVRVGRMEIDRPRRCAAARTGT